MAATVLFTGCTKDKFSKNLIIECLTSPYTANVDFVTSNGEKGTAGKVIVTKADITTLTFTSPESYNGISIKSDASGNEDIFSFELSGIPAAVPKTIAGDLSLMFSLFSDVMAQKISSLDGDAFSFSGQTNGLGNELIEVFFVENGMSYSLTYDRHSGVPHTLDAGNDEISVSLVLSDFTRTSTQNT